jgi:hypothetical protein
MSPDTLPATGDANRAVERLAWRWVDLAHEAARAGVPCDAESWGERVYHIGWLARHESETAAAAELACFEPILDDLHQRILATRDDA